MAQNYSGIIAISLEAANEWGANKWIESS